MTRSLISILLIGLAVIAALRYRKPAAVVEVEEQKPGYRYRPGMEKADPKKIKSIGKRKWKQVVKAQRELRKAETKTKPKKPLALMERRTGTDA